MKRKKPGLMSSARLRWRPGILMPLLPRLIQADIRFANYLPMCESYSARIVNMSKQICVPGLIYSHHHAALKSPPGLCFPPHLCLREIGKACTDSDCSVDR